MNKRVVISGVNGFVGHHLIRELKVSGYSVVGIGTEERATTQIASSLEAYYSQDLVEAWPDTEDVVGVIHLAGLAAVGPSFDKPQTYINKNSAMVTNMCEHYISQKNKMPRILIVSSGAVYDSGQTMPLSESSSIGFNSPYSVSKILNENQAKYYRGRGLDIVAARPFNHIGPGQGEGFLLPDLYRQIMVAKENGEPVITGDLSTKRDYTDVRDIARAYRMIISADNLEHDTYNVCSIRSMAGNKILEKIMELTKSGDLNISTDPSKIRPNDIKDIVGDSSRIQNELGWNPQISLDQTIKDFVSQSL